MSNNFHHSIRFRIYYEDTDAGGIVYYANYLKFAERARTEWLRDCGYTGPEFMKEGLGFVVRKVEAQYHAPAQLDDLIEVQTRLITLSRASLTLQQNIFCVKDNQPLLSSLQLQLACVNLQQARPKAIPGKVYSVLDKVSR